MKGNLHAFENQFKKNLLINFKKIKINKAKNIFITSNLSKLAKTNIPKEKILEIILETLKTSMGKNYSIFSPASTLNLCNTNKIFDLKKTPSYNMGPLAEYIRKIKNSVRCIHPFWSVVCIGKNSKLLKKVSPHAYGVGSAWSIMLDLDTVQLNLGIHPSKAITLIHHIETVFKVPYRYDKKFIQKINNKGKIYKDEFYLSVLYNDKSIKKKKKLNEHFFKKMKNLNKLNYTTDLIGLDMWSFKMRDFYSVASKMFKKDIFTYLEKKPNLKNFNIKKINK